MGGSGSKTQQTQTSQTQEQAPWAPTIKPLTSLVKQINGQVGNTALTGNENAALDQIMQNAQAGNPYLSQIKGVASQLLGGGTDRTGIASDAYSNYQNQAQPYLSADYLNPYNNPAFKQYLDTTTQDAANSINGMYASVGRDMSGSNAQNLARGIGQATAPIFANQYNQNVATQTGMMGNLYNAGNSTAGLLSGLDQTALGNKTQGVTAANAALDAANYAPNAVLAAQGLARGLPLQNIGQITSMLTPLAGLGGTMNSTGTSNQQMSYTQPMAQTFGQWMQPFSGGQSSGFNGALGAIGTGLSLFSDRRLKEDVKRVGKLDNGLPVYSFRYKGHPQTVIGLMADDVEKTAPEAVGEHGGYKTVDYAAATGAR